MKRFLKGNEIARLGSIPRVSRGKYEIEITELKAIEDGVEFYVRAWQDGVPVGLGVGSMCEKEHFIVINPPVLVDDPAGNIIREWTDKTTGELKRRKLREDLREALLQVVEHNIKVTGKKGTAVLGRVGLTTYTFYPDAGGGGSNVTCDGQVQYWNTTDWATAHDAAVGRYASSDGFDYTSTEINGGFVWTDGSNHWQIVRGFLTFNTSALGSGASINSATLSLVGKYYNSTSYSMRMTTHTSATDNILVNADYSRIGTTGIATDKSL